MTRRLTLSGLFSIVSLLAPSPGVAISDDTKLDTVLKTFRAEFVEVTPGKGKFADRFRRGDAAGSANEQPVRQIHVSRPFHIAKYEVWQDLYEQVMGYNPSRWKGPRNSAEMMTWTDAVAFCEKATALMRERKLIAETDTIRLPTESEWEYCCRAGTETAYSFGDAAQAPGDAAPKASLLDPYAWHTGNAAGNDPPVGALKPNPWGLYDMHGYLREFCLDSWSDSNAAVPEEAHLPAAGGDATKRPVRGGSWKDPFPRLRSAARSAMDVTGADDAVGFRCLLVSDVLP